MKSGSLLRHLAMAGLVAVGSVIAALVRIALSGPLLHWR